jgi:hypothetical protein
VRDPTPDRILIDGERAMRPGLKVISFAKIFEGVDACVRRREGRARRGLYFPIWRLSSRSARPVPARRARCLRADRDRLARARRSRRAGRASRGTRAEGRDHRSRLAGDGGRGQQSKPADLGAPPAPRSRATGGQLHPDSRSAWLSFHCAGYTCRGSGAYQCRGPVVRRSAAAAG